ncbi:Piso0_003835 [Millerozyma farinosa CBS 7064]|uniref:Endoplasmic reticulum transmembrane protein n=1 Tax=Pichia sorbitophila (strain ATCC MYA-4447 / BCRC 22081 / CBS 7064 / NBRC 10061 / NRRL Y-12695) TaxID=559304 RepID=G8Y9N0_PICSO|nr:Piso0_003835 [Millerozyma farinosa CBS 7064]CCE84294.1 Piso0_003835 [Millerozyma farinosa CBS 7064]
MALYYNLVFGLLVIEVGFFTVLSLPFPRQVRRKVLSTASAPFRNEQFQIAIKCILGFVLVLFIDSVNRLVAVTRELQSKPSESKVTGIINDRAEVQARRFYAQRNMYLCGFTLFLTLILMRTYSLVGELILTKDKLDNAKANKEYNDDSEEVKRLKEELEAKNENIEILKEQASSLSKDYDQETSTEAKSRKA